MTGEEGELGFFVGARKGACIFYTSEEEAERGFSVRVRKMGSGGNWAVTKVGESSELQYKWKRGGRRVFLGLPPLQEIWASPCKKQKQMGFKMDRLLYRHSRLPVFRTGGP